MTRGKSAHEHVEGSLAAAVDLVMAVRVVGEAALPGRHDTDRSGRLHKILKRLDYPHWTQRVRHHDAHEFLGRDVGDRFAIVVFDASVHEKYIQPSILEAIV